MDIKRPKTEFKIKDKERVLGGPSGKCTKPHARRVTVDV